MMPGSSICLPFVFKPVLLKNGSERFLVAKVPLPWQVLIGLE